jgi:hypothetical protein
VESQRLLLLDACCVINLYATGRIEQILLALPYRCAVVRYVLQDETLNIGLEGGGPDERERADLAWIVERGLLDVAVLSSADEKAEHVRFARELDEGEAQTCAVAAVHGAAVATDDRRALRLLEREGLAAVQTAELLYSWARAREPAVTEIQQALRRVESLARFRPRQDSPSSDWWYRFSAP